MKNNKNTILNSKKISKIITKSMLEKKASDIKLLYVNKLTTLTDIFIICTSNSEPQAKALTNHIKDRLEKEGIKPLSIEGYQQLKWVLIDYVNVTVNIFNQEYRNYYNIERLWSDAKIEIIKESTTT
tara:strand:- start:105 stop:485 length:381 start_codon:yes stop_codon:yes gene_type:complete